MRLTPAPVARRTGESCRVDAVTPLGCMRAPPSELYWQLGLHTALHFFYTSRLSTMEVFQPVELLLGVFCQSIVIGQPSQLSVISSNDLVVTEVKQFGTMYGLQAVIVPIASGLAELLDPLFRDIEVYLLIDRPLLRMSSANRDFHFFLVRVASDFVSQKNHALSSVCYAALLFSDGQVQFLLQEFFDLRHYLISLRA